MIRFPYDKVDVPFIKDHLITKGKPAMMVETAGFGGLSSIVGKEPEPSDLEKERRIKVLQEMGASRSQAQALLARFGWNVDLSAGVYFDANQR